MCLNTDSATDPTTGGAGVLVYTKLPFLELYFYAVIEIFAQQQYNVNAPPPRPSGRSFLTIWP